MEVLRVKAPVGFQTRAATSGAGLQRRSKARARRQCQRYQTRTEAGHGARIRSRVSPLFKKKLSPRPARGVLQLLHKIASACSASREVAAWSRWPDPPLHLSLSPVHPVLQTRSFLAGLRGDSSSSSPSESPTCDGPMAAPPQRQGPALTPVDAAPRRLPFLEDRYSTWGDPRAVLPSGKPRPRFKVGMLGIRPGTCRAGLQTSPSLTLHAGR